MIDNDNRPYYNIRILHTLVLDDPFEDAPEFPEMIPPNSPIPIESVPRPALPQSV